MPHFPARFGGLFAVQMNAGAGFFKISINIFNIFADQVDHNGVAVPCRRGEGKSAHRPHMVFELRGGAGIDRPVAGIMRARRDFVGQQIPLPRQEQFQGQNTPQIDRAGQPPGHIDGLALDGGATPAGTVVWCKM